MRIRELRHSWTILVAMVLGVSVWARLAPGRAGRIAVDEPVVRYSTGAPGVRQFTIAFPAAADAWVARAEPTCDCLTLRAPGRARVTGTIRCHAKPDWVVPVVLVTLTSGRTLPVPIRCVN